MVKDKKFIFSFLFIASLTSCKEIFSYDVFKNKVNSFETHEYTSCVVTLNGVEYTFDYIASIHMWGLFESSESKNRAFTYLQLDAKKFITTYDIYESTMPTIVKKLNFSFFQDDDNYFAKSKMVFELEKYNNEKQINCVDGVEFYSWNEYGYLLSYSRIENGVSQKTEVSIKYN